LSVRALLSCFALACACGHVQAVQQPDPTDAKEFLARHATFANSPRTTRVDEQAILSNARFYLHAGAAGELRAEIAKLDEVHPVSMRYAMLADCWNPATYQLGLERSHLWLDSFPERDEIEQQSVRGVRDYLDGMEQRRAEFLQRRSTTAWLPFLSILAVIGIFTVGVRRWP